MMFESLCSSSNIITSLCELALIKMPVMINFIMLIAIFLSLKASYRDKYKKYQEPLYLTD